MVQDYSLKSAGVAGSHFMRLWLEPIKPLLLTNDWFKAFS